LVLGLPSDLPRKNCWSIAGWAGEASPDGIDPAEVRPGCHRLLIRRNRTTGELACCRCFSPARAPRPRWYASPGRDGGWRRLSRPERAWPDWDEHQIRRFTLWSGRVTLAIARSRLPRRRPRRRTRPVSQAGQAGPTMGTDHHGCRVAGARDPFRPVPGHPSRDCRITNRVGAPSCTPNAYRSWTV
jgi:hypothetical protein